MIIRKMLCFSLVSLVLGFGLFCSTADAAEDYVKLIGAGASFPAPLYSKWFKDYHGLHPNVQVDYQSVGSGSGIKNFINKTVDFGASDAGMKPEEIAQVDAGVQLLPMTAGAIVLSYNLEGVPELKLSREAYAGIFLGKVTKWNDPLIAKANPDAKLPDSPINVVVRADSSGTTFVFSQHLAAISPEFAKSPGVNMMPNWAVGTRSKGNEGITASLRTTPGSIGYVEYGYAKGQRLAMAALENKAGKFVKASTSIRPGVSGRRGNARRPDGMVARPHRGRFLSHRDLYLDALLQALRRCKQTQSVKRRHRIRPDGRTKEQRATRLRPSACPGRSKG